MTPINDPPLKDYPLIVRYLRVPYLIIRIGVARLLGHRP